MSLRDALRMRLRERCFRSKWHLLEAVVATEVRDVTAIVELQAKDTVAAILHFCIQISLIRLNNLQKIYS